METLFFYFFVACVTCIPILVSLIVLLVIKRDYELISSCVMGLVSCVIFATVFYVNLKEWSDKAGVYAVTWCSPPESPTDTLDLIVEPIELEKHTWKPIGILFLQQDNVIAGIKDICATAENIDYDRHVSGIYGCIRVERTFTGKQTVTALHKCPKKTYGPYKFEWKE